MTRTAQPPNRAAILRVIALVVFFCAAPTAGDIGGCGQSEVALDPVAFFGNKQQIDCTQCMACGITTPACASACAGGTPDPDAFPAGCLPLVHDGEVCLDALNAASCADYTSYTAAQGATVPSECDFCPVGGP